MKRSGESLIEDFGNSESSHEQLDFNVLNDCLFTEGDFEVTLDPLDNERREASSNSSTSPSHAGNKSEDDELGGTMGPDFVDRRRERNRVLARKTRLRKKFFFESLQRQVAQLAKENLMLKEIVRTKMQPDLKVKVLSECTTELPAIVTQTASQASSLLDKADFNLMGAIQAAQRSFVVSDPALPDNPIVFASQGFLDLTGYKLGEVIGRNCRFLQGPDTDIKEVARMRECIMRGEDTSTLLVNYKADGTKFHNQIFVAALKDSNHDIVNYVGVQVEINPEEESRRSEQDALLALPAAKKGRPRIKDRDKGIQTKTARARPERKHRAISKEPVANDMIRGPTDELEGMVSSVSSDINVNAFSTAPCTLPMSHVQQIEMFNQAALMNVNSGFYQNALSGLPSPGRAVPVDAQYTGSVAGYHPTDLSGSSIPMLEPSGKLFMNMDVPSLLGDDMAELSWGADF